mmetsp:Transcript_32780/g.47328  ORF Transcript_32780/g.47328 Transcript_32780/m.47328 type:complete len:230 (-) Transcript_32780:1325-2014(-)
MFIVRLSSGSNRHLRGFHGMLGLSAAANIVRWSEGWLHCQAAEVRVAGIICHCWGSFAGSQLRRWNGTNESGTEAGPKQLGSHQHNGGHACRHVPVDVAVQQPHSRIVRHEDEFHPALRRHGDRVPLQVVRLVELLGLRIVAGGHYPVVVAVEMQGVLTQVSVVDEHDDGFVERDDEWMGAISQGEVQLQLVVIVIPSLYFRWREGIRKQVAEQQRRVASGQGRRIRLV